MERKWWHDKVAYQIYPKSFNDTNGDGIGDLRGIINKLDYLKLLGVDIIWICPIYVSPFIDQGYDISDYYNIDPQFGTMDDFDELLAEAKKRDMYILMDLVVNHCSDQHIWFQKMLENPEGEYADYFYVREGKEGKPPCNWRSYFGGNVWEKIPGTDKYYLHLFAKEQPDLNWENPIVREEIYKMMNWWLDKGLAGFRIDAIVNIKKDLTFSDMEPDRDDGMCSSYKMVENAKGLEDFLFEMKARTFKPHDAFSIGELFNYKKEDLENYIGENGCFSTIFDFSTDQINATKTGWQRRIDVTPKLYKEAIFESQSMAKGVGFMANIIENHDEPRGVSRYLPNRGQNEVSKKMLATVMMMLRGLPFLYQGQEIGMTNNAFESIEDVNDIETIWEYNEALKLGYTKEEALGFVNKFSRDHSRTPMQWNESDHAGFTSGKPWLIVNQNYKKINVSGQLNDESSIFNYYRKLIALRKNPQYSDVLVSGEFVAIEDTEDSVMAFLRKNEEFEILVLANFSDQETVFKYPKMVKQVLMSNFEDGSIGSRVGFSQGYKLRPFETLVLELN